VAQRCIYGVDKNPFAVNLAKLSLWLATLAKDLPFTFIDHALKYGDSLVGLTRAEIGSFGREVENTPLLRLLNEQVEQAKSYRAAIQAGDTRTDDEAETKAEQLLQAEAVLHESKLIGSVIVASFFDGSNPKERKENRVEYAEEVRGFRQSGEIDNLESLVRDWQKHDHAIISFNWELEFPEVFDRENGGFDAIVGNPPFAGKNTTISGHAEGYLDWLKEVYPESHGNSDLVAYFFRKAFTLLRKDGCLGLIATNTIAQGDTRSTGLRFVCKDGGTIYNAQKRVKWAGDAAVVVSVLNIKKGIYAGAKLLDGKEVPLISAFLFHAGGHEDPKPLAANAGKSFIGSYVLGMGFTFDDSNPDATSIEEMHRLIEKDPKNAERIFPYIGGEEVNSSPTHSHHRYVINFFDLEEEKAWQYLDLMQIVKDKVKPERDVQKRDALRLKWWQYAEKRPGLVKAIAPLERVLVISRVAQHWGFTFLPKAIVYSDSLVVIANSEYSSLSILQSRLHELWSRFFGSSLEL
jgi:hypothetical protein